MEGGGEVSVDENGGTPRWDCGWSDRPQARPRCGRAAVRSCSRVALWQGLAASHSSVAPAAHFRASARHLALARLRAAEQEGSLEPAPRGAGSDLPSARRQNPAYRARGSAGTFQATSPTQRFSIGFGRSGVTLSSRAVRAGLSLTGVGFGASLNPVGQVAPRAKCQPRLL